MSLDTKLASDEIKGLGIDLAYIPWMTKLVEGYDRETLKLLFTAKEIDCCQSSSYPHRDFTVCFATKEAVAKAFGTGITEDIEWNQIEAHLTQDKLTICLHGRANVLAKRATIYLWKARWWHWDEHVLVHALAI
ncbi:Phosphopantetheine--protein transferase [Hyella patelloides LEGE 07179]|uniref:Phosphopantetheine--protein transferase n=1 Tax=Hyella patelloides LEGE 07179 TaxID=945734 RepID=A0A563VWA7_9CYAN|nr:4'-phosphopantetheinyl transferase superfamily protein [Hyella patelloides]VEP15739.1 Phosphopantetheine--protein transferase [Hyella patelloides LEGE 07179]